MTEKNGRLSRRRRRQVGWAVAGVLFVLLLLLAFRPTPLAVEAGEVTRGPLEITVDAEGMTRVIDRFQVGAPVSGRLERVMVEEGDPVRQGQILARMTATELDPQSLTRARAAVATAQAGLEEATARIAQTRSVMEQAQRNAERIGAIADAGAVSAEARERAELEAATATREFEAAGARARAASSDLVAARTALADADPAANEARGETSVSAPASGRVLRVYERSERVVPAGTPIVDVGDAEGLEIVVDVLSSDAVRVAPGARIRVVQWGGEEELEGRVRLVEPSAFTRISALGVEEQRVNVIGDLFDPPAALGDGYRIEAHIVTWEAAEVVRVPSSALFQDGRAWAVFTVAGGRAQLRPVQVGRRGVAEAEVLEGLEPGEKVVIFPGDQLSDGARVTS